MCKQRVGLRIRRIKLNCSFQQLPSHRVVVLRARIDTGKRTHDTLPGVQAFRLLALCSYTLGSAKLRLNRCHYPLSYLVLKRKDAGEFPVIAFGPDMMPGDGINELRTRTRFASLRTLPRHLRSRARPRACSPSAGKVTRASRNDVAVDADAQSVVVLILDVIDRSRLG